MSKGSKPRPVDKSSFDKNYDKIFGKKKLSSLTDTEDKNNPEYIAVINIEEIVKNKDKK